MNNCFTLIFTTEDTDNVPTVSSLACCEKGPTLITSRGITKIIKTISLSWSSGNGQHQLKTTKRHERHLEWVVMSNFFTVTVTRYHSKRLENRQSHAHLYKRRPAKRQQLQARFLPQRSFQHNGTANMITRYWAPKFNKFLLIASKRVLKTANLWHSTYRIHTWSTWNYEFNLSNWRHISRSY